MHKGQSVVDLVQTYSIFMNIKAVLLDLDGVLVNSWPFIMASFDHVLTHFKLPKEGLKHPKMRHITLHQAYEHLGLQDDFDEAFKIHIEFQKKNLHLLQRFPDTEFALDNLKKKFRIGVVSNRTGNSSQLLKHCGLLDYVEIVIGAENVTWSKPHPQGIFLACEHFGVEPEEAIMVGDTPSDIIAGKSAGAWTVALNTSNCYDELKKVSPGMIINNLSELIPVLKATLAGKAGYEY